MRTGALIRVYVVDAHPVFLAAVVEAIGARPELGLVGAARTGSEALAGIRGLRPDVAVLEMRLPGVSGLELLRRAAADGAPTHRRRGVGRRDRRGRARRDRALCGRPG